MRSPGKISALIVLMSAAWSCDKAPQPVARVSATPSTVEIPYPGYANLELEWDMQAPLDAIEGRPLVFVHLIDGDGSVKRTFDHTLPFDWEPGASRSYAIPLYQSALAPPLEAGTYRLTLGLYDASGKRWAFEESGEAVANLEYLVASVDTQGDPADVPMFYFSPAWLPLEAGTDVQIMGRRWLTGEGTLRVAEVPGSGVVWMSLKISEAVAGREELSLNEGESEPGLLVRSTCGGDELSLRGYGNHQLEIPIKANEEGQLPTECEISLQPTFQIVEVDTLTRRSVGLEVLSWKSN
jgi:hypothetical protein